MLSAVLTAAAASPPATAKHSHSSKSFSSQQSQRGDRHRACAAFFFSQQKRLLRAFSSAAAEPIHPANPTKYCEQFFKTCSGLTQLARISPTKLSTYYRDLSSSVSIAFCCSSNALRSAALSAISFFSRPMAIVTFIH